MDIFELINSRQSIRTYKKDPVSDEVIGRILNAARMAPSWANKQCWRFVVVSSKVEKLLIGKASGQDNIAKACEDAPYVVVQCANSKESGSKNGLDYYLYDCGLSMQNLVLAAQAEGMATCIVGWFDEKAVRGILNIPQDFRVVAFTPLGYAGEKVLSRSRRKVEETVFHNQWGKA